MSNISLEELDRKVKALSGETQDLKQDLASIRNGSSGGLAGRSARFEERETGGPAPTRGMAIVVIAAVLATAVCAGVVWLVTQKMLQSSISTIQKDATAAAKQAVRTAMHGMKTIVQFGKFTTKNKASSEPLAFDWTLKTPVDPEHVLTVTPEFISAPGPVGVSAEITEGGKKCRMTVTGATAQMLEKLSSGLDAKVTIMLDADQLGALEHK